MKKIVYKKPATRTIALLQQCQLLNNSQTVVGPTAKFMSNPRISDSDEDNYEFEE